MAAERSVWWTRGSIKARVTFAATSLLALTLIVSALVLSGLEKRALLQGVDASLNDRLNGVLDAVVGGTLQVDVPLTGRETGIVQVVDSDDVVLAATPGLHGRPDLAVFVPPAGRTEHRTVRASFTSNTEETWRVAARRVAGREIRLFAATDLGSIDIATSRLRSTLLAGIPLLIAAFGFVSWLATRWSLAPVLTLTDTVDSLSENSLETPLPDPGTGDEMAKLVHTVNALLHRVAVARQRERRFAADASHELRTPITTARLNLEIAKANPTQESLERAVDETLIEIDRLEVLARELLELTRLDAGRVSAKAVPFDIRTMIEIELGIRRRNSAEISFTSAGVESVEVLGVSALVLRVLRNLLDNAERHASSMIDVSVTRVNDTAEIVVYNDGPPISNEDRDRVFEPFTRLDDARSREVGGTGLGLAIVADIVAAHGGQVAVLDDQWIRQHRQRGTAFRFTLPTAPAGAY